eukprot:c14453_g1_i1.p1 GENE.c14453_g1_i1~~c14453_g1_i1.p1  ORF type:complete len:419 (+),score=180.36 c14453_g1_i1:22-1257(+)
MQVFWSFLFCLLLSVVFSDDSQKTTYKCGTECEKELMGSSDPLADSMPHVLGSSIPQSPQALLKAMNAYLKENTAAEEALLMVPHPHAAMPDSAIINSASFKTVPEGDRIPEGHFEDRPSLRRPCNLDQVLELLKSIKHEYKAEDDHASKLHEAQVEASSPLTAAKVSLDEAQKRVDTLREAKKANETLTTVMQTIALKIGVLEELMKQKSSLILEEGSLKAPIIKTIGRTNLNLQSAANAKQNALNDFAQHPAFTKDEMQQIITTYDELIISIKKQLTSLQQEASDVLTPIQMNINQTSHAIERLESEIQALRKEQQKLITVADQYSSVALEGAEAILETLVSHFNAEKSAQAIQVESFDQSTIDRASITQLVDQLISLVTDIQQPQETSVVQTPQHFESLAGSIPVVKK